jgi:hypothetical protein
MLNPLRADFVIKHEEKTAELKEAIKAARAAKATEMAHGHRVRMAVLGNYTGEPPARGEMGTAEWKEAVAAGEAANAAEEAHAYRVRMAVLGNYTGEPPAPGEEGSAEWKEAVAAGEAAVAAKKTAISAAYLRALSIRMAGLGNNAEPGPSLPNGSAPFLLKHGWLQQFEQQSHAVAGGAGGSAGGGCPSCRAAGRVRRAGARPSLSRASPMEVRLPCWTTGGSSTHWLLVRGDRLARECPSRRAAGLVTRCRRKRGILASTGPGIGAAALSGR